jgi:hypothetical protein
MQRKGIVNGVNQAGKAASPEEEQEIKVQSRRRTNPLVAGLMRLLSVFGNLVSPIEDAKKRK